MATTEVENAWRESGIAGRDVSTHLAFVQGYVTALEAFGVDAMSEHPAWNGAGEAVRNRANYLADQARESIERESDS